MANYIKFQATVEEGIYTVIPSKGVNMLQKKVFATIDGVKTYGKFRVNERPIEENGVFNFTCKIKDDGSYRIYWTPESEDLQHIANMNLIAMADRAHNVLLDKAVESRFSAITQEAYRKVKDEIVAEKTENIKASIIRSGYTY